MKTIALVVVMMAGCGGARAVVECPPHGIDGADRATAPNAYAAAAVCADAGARLPTAEEWLMARDRKTTATPDGLEWFQDGNEIATYDWAGNRILVYVVGPPVPAGVRCVCD